MSCMLSLSSRHYLNTVSNNNSNIRHSWWWQWWLYTNNNTVRLFFLAIVQIQTWLFNTEWAHAMLSSTFAVWSTAIGDCDWSRYGHVETHDAQATPTRTPVQHYRSMLKVNVAHCMAVRNVTRLVHLRKFFHLSFLWSFFLKIYGQTCY